MDNLESSGREWPAPFMARLPGMAWAQLLEEIFARGEALYNEFSAFDIASEDVHGILLADLMRLHAQVDEAQRRVLATMGRNAVEN